MTGRTRFFWQRGIQLLLDTLFPRDSCGTLMFSHGNRCCTFAEHREETSMVQQVGGTMEMEAKILEVPEGLLKGLMGMWRRTKG